MSISTIPGNQNRPGRPMSAEYLAQSTATVLRLISRDADITYLGAGTATQGNTLNIYALPDGYPGQEKWVSLGTTTAATGGANLITIVGTGTSATGATNMFDTLSTDGTRAAATGFLVLQTSSDFVRLRFSDAEWTIEEMVGATVFTAS